ncbi:hypothetical protein CBER1_10985 [Cercospora berteroae]|uniref:Uncharacterized protein n=1 Tax=Cercospora berteroae TaxID=357750 RepID=A0A2S6BXH3_9PEZI|nr:hypothetical protein CBER1_10985 [Cercospora berteroae]
MAPAPPPETAAGRSPGLAAQRPLQTAIELQDHCHNLAEALRSSERQRSNIETQAQQTQYGYKIKLQTARERLSQAYVDNKALLGQVEAWEKTCVTLREDRGKWLQMYQRTQSYLDEVLSLINATYNTEPPPSYNDFDNDQPHISTGDTCSSIQTDIRTNYMQALANANVAGDLSSLRAFRILAHQCSSVQQSGDFDALVVGTSLLCDISFALLSANSSRDVFWHDDRDAMLVSWRQIDETLLLIMERYLRPHPRDQPRAGPCCGQWANGFCGKSTACETSWKIWALKYSVSSITSLRALAAARFSPELGNEFLEKSRRRAQKALVRERMKLSPMNRMLSEFRVARDMASLGTAVIESTRGAWGVLKSSMEHAKSS